MAQFLAPGDKLAVKEPQTSQRPPAPARIEPQKHLSIISPQSLQVVEDGKEVVRPDVMLSVLLLDGVDQLFRIRKSLEREQFQGKIDHRDLNATDEYQHIDLIDEWPHTPWATAYFYNRGPNSVYISANEHRPFLKLLIKEDYSLDFTKADRRIDFIEYYCDTGETATVSTIGKY